MYKIFVIFFQHLIERIIQKPSLVEKLASTINAKVQQLEESSDDVSQKENSPKKETSVTVQDGGPPKDTVGKTDSMPVPDVVVSQTVQQGEPQAVHGSTGQEAHHKYEDMSGHIIDEVLDMQVKMIIQSSIF